MRPEYFYKAGLAAIYFFICFQLSAKAQSIRGVVKDAVTGQPVSSSNVIVLKSSAGTISDVLGNFRISASDMADATMVVSSLGYAPDTIQLSAENYFYEILLKPVQSTLNEVVVTGVSKAMLLRENPVAIVPVGTRAIETTTESNIIDVLVKNVAGLNALKTGPNISKPFIRGLGYNRVLTLYDGIRQEGQQWGDEHGLEVDAYNIYKAEVVKGPSSIMYGSDAVAGVVSLMPEMPVNTDGKMKGKYFTEYQSNNGLVGNGISVNYSKNNWAYTVRGSFRMATNYLNRIDGRVYNTGFRESNASSTVQHFSQSGYSNINLTLYDNLQGIPDGSRDSLTRKFTRQIYEGNNDDIKRRPVVPESTLNAYALSPLHQRIQHYRVYSNNHYKLAPGDVDFLLAFQQNIRREYSHPTAPQQAGLYVRLNTINYGLRYNAPTMLHTEISAGINGMYQTNKSKDATDFPIPDYDLLDIGGYVYAKWKKNRLTVSGGFRYDNRHLQGNNFYVGTNPVTGFSMQVSSADLPGVYLQFPAFDKIFKGTSFSIGTTYELNEHVALKANLAKGYRAPGITELASNGLDPGAHIIYLGNRNFMPEYSIQEDVGVNVRYNNISATASVFNNNIENYIYMSQLTDANGNAVLDAQGNKTFQYLQGKAQLYGLEATLGLNPLSMRGFSIENAFSVIYAYNRKPDFKGRGIDGEYLPLIPPAKLLSSLNQELNPVSKVFSMVKMKAEIEYNAAQNRYLSLNRTETATPDFTLFNFSVYTIIHYSKTNTIQFQVQVNNVFDIAYQSNLSRLKYFENYGSSPNGHLGIYNMGRNICVKAVVLF
jgi:iron complex outermembrane recepter protein